MHISQIDMYYKLYEHQYFNNNNDNNDAVRLVNSV